MILRKVSNSESLISSRVLLIGFGVLVRDERGSIGVTGRERALAYVIEGLHIPVGYGGIFLVVGRGGKLWVS